MRAIGICAALTVTMASPAFGAIADEIATEATRGQQLILHRRYDEAIALFRHLAEAYPGSPTGTFGELSVWQTRMFENYDYRFATEYEAALKRHRPVVDAVLAARDPSDWDLFVCGASLGMQGFYLARAGRWLKALGVADRAMGALRKLLWRNPRFIDADLGIGLYEYWRSVFTKSVRFLPFFRDKRAEAIAKVEAAAREGRYAVELARANLGFLYAEERRFPAAIEALVGMLDRYPDNIVLRMQLGQAYLAIKDYPKAIGAFRRILAIDPSVTKAAFYVGFALGREGRDMAGARRALQHYLATGPEHEWATAAQTLLERWK